MDDQASVRRFTLETGASEAAAMNYLGEAKGNYLLAKQNYLKTKGTKRSATSSSSSASRVGTIGGLGDDKKEHELYAGGSSSGLSQLGPDKPGKMKMPAKEEVKRVFEKLQADGVLSKAAYEAGKTADGGFAGSGQKLSGERVASKQRRVNSVKVVFYRDGFVLSTAPSVLRLYSDPASGAFLSAIERQTMPDELAALAAANGDLDVELLDKKTEAFEPPAVEREAFEGHGQSLKSENSAEAQTAAKEAAQNAPAEFTLDEAAPITTLQIRLHDGSKLVQKFNHTHKIAHIRAFVNSARPEMAAETYQFATTFPRKVLTDESLSLADANLLNAVVMQKKC